MKYSRILAATLFSVLIPASSFAEDVDSIFKKMDDVTNGYQDSMMSIHMTVVDVNGSEKTYDYDIFQKGEQRLLKFHSGEVKGMATLVKSPSEVYAYLPSQKKTRRIAAHKMGQSFAGSDMTSDDMAFTSWVKAYKPVLDKEDEQYWYITATALQNAPFPTTKIKIDKKNYQLAEFAYYNDKNELVKTFTNTGMKDWGGCFRNQFVVISDGRTKHKTKLEVREFKINQGYKDDMFSKRELEWGR